MSNEITSILKTCPTCKQSFPSLRQLIAHEKTHGNSTNSKTKTATTNSSFSSSTVIKPEPTCAEDNKWICPICSVFVRSRWWYNRHFVKCHAGPRTDFSVKKIEKPTIDEIEPESGNRKDEFTETEELIDKTEQVEQPVLDEAEEQDRIPDSDQSNQQKETVFTVGITLHKGTKLRRALLLDQFQSDVDFCGSLHNTNGSTSTISIHKKSGIGNQSFRENLHAQTSFNGTCEYCLGIFSSRYCLHRHQLRKHHTDDGRVRYYCFNCAEKEKNIIYFSNRQEFRAHQEIEHGIILEIKDGDADGSISSTMNAAARTSYPCEYCYGIYMDRQKLQIHQTRRHREDDGEMKYFCFKCCGFRSKKHITYAANKKEFKTHMKKVHGMTKPTDNGGHSMKYYRQRRSAVPVGSDSWPSSSVSRGKQKKPTFCNYCLGSFTLLEKHIQRMHTTSNGNKIYCCFECAGSRHGLGKPVYFPNEKTFREHVLASHGIPIERESMDGEIDDESTSAIRMEEAIDEKPGFLAVKSERMDSDDGASDASNVEIPESTTAWTAIVKSEPTEYGQSNVQEFMDNECKPLDY